MKSIEALITIKLFPVPVKQPDGSVLNETKVVATALTRQGESFQMNAQYTVDAISRFANSSVSLEQWMMDEAGKDLIEQLTAGVE